MFELRTNLFGYQKQAVEKLSKLKVGALYCEMGTGKTRIALSLVRPRLEKFKIDTILWLCPCSVRNDLKEDLIYHCGSVPDEIIIRGIESLSSSDRLYMELMRLVERKKVFLIVDESNLVKNKHAIRTSRITEISKHCQYKLILNGTPVSKNEADLFAQWYILDWRILGYQSYYSFAANHLEYSTIRLPNGKEVINKNRVRRVLNVDYLTEKIAPYTFHIKKEECLNLPEKTYYLRFFHLPEKHATIYSKTKVSYLENVNEFREETIYKLFTALQHISSGKMVVSEPYDRMITENIYNNPCENPRIQCLFRTIENDIGNEKCIIFCKYQSEIDEISQIMDEKGMKYVTYTGKISHSKRWENREKFRNDAQLFISSKSCGAYGLNLQFCHNIIYYSNDFDLATRMQSEDRVHRIGQTNKIRIYDICARDTIDQFISDCLLRKERLVDAFKRELKRLKETEMKNISGKINIGYRKKQKEEAIEKYLTDHAEINHVIVFYPDGWEHLSIKAEYIPYSEIIMYRTFYPLLEKIDNTYLLVYDECMRTKKRTDLTYNCAHKYNNQTEHIMVFEFFPFIDDPQDFMILADFIDHVKMRPKKFDESVFEDIPISVINYDFAFEKETVIVPDDADEKYEAEKQKLFENLGKKDPDTVPNALEIFVGKWKKPEFDQDYVARNSRYKADNVSTYKEKKVRKEVVLIDLPLNQKDFNDYVKLSGCEKMTFLHTGLSVDNYFFDRYQKWFEEVKKFNETASIYERKRITSGKTKN